MDVPEGSPFTLASLPFGTAGGRVLVAIGDRAVDVTAAAWSGHLDVDPDAVTGQRLDGLLAAQAWRGLREQIGSILRDDPERLATAMVDRATLVMDLPVTIGDYVDGYGGLHHAMTCGQIFRPDTDGLLPNYRHVPVGYHGRSGTIVVSGSEVRRPSGQMPIDGVPTLRPTSMLDIELELGVIVGVGSEHGVPVPVGQADAHVFGYVLVNDWSARDVQGWESQPLGPFLGKSFVTSISPWVVVAEALAPHRVVGLAGAQDPAPPAYLQGDPAVPDLHLSIDLNGHRLTDVDLAPNLYWTAAQQLAHATVNGASLRPGDLFASGTISGTDHRVDAGSLLERTWAGTQPFTLPDGTERTFLEDGDEVVLDGWVGEGDARVGFGGLSGRIVGTST